MFRLKKVVAFGMCISFVLNSCITVSAENYVNSLNFSSYVDTDADISNLENLSTQNNTEGNEDVSSFQMSSEPEVIYSSVIKGENRTQSFNDNWKFYLGNAEGAEVKNYDDSSWRNVDLPHDYSIEQEFNKNFEAESGYLAGGIGWYRKSFTLSQELSDKKVRIDFGGVYMDSTIWVNGHLLGNHPYGYTSFSFDITPYINFGEENVIAVKVNHQVPSSRWYSGSGIYRNTAITITDKVHVDLNGIKLSSPNLENDISNTSLIVDTKIKNDSDLKKQVTLAHTLYEKGKQEVIAIFESVETEIESENTSDIKSEIPVTAPKLWSVKNPNLYTVKTEVKVDGEVVDTIFNDYGFRYFKFQSNNGFSLNGEYMKLKGVCMHHDQGALGAVANPNAMKRQIEILKDMGCNSIRVTHNPAAREFIEICDELGMLVIEEAFDGWEYSKNGNNYDYARFFNKKAEKSNMTWAESDLRSIIKRDYNSPSVIMWSLGNEVTEGAAENESYVSTSQKLINWAKDEDSTRLVTTGDNRLKGSSIGSIYGRIAQNLNEANGIVGLNYAKAAQLDNWHRNQPEWKIYASETASAVNSRGIYKINGYLGKNGNNQLTSYDESTVGWGKVASDAWYDIIQRDYISGEYVWTGFDYIGEPTHWNGTNRGAKGGRNNSWPAPKNSFFGIVDTAGFPKDSYYLYRSLWNNDSTTLHILPAWKEDVVEKNAGGEVSVVVYSNAKSVRLYFTPENGTEQDLGLKTFTTKASNGGKYSYQLYEGEGKSNVAHKNLYLQWSVPYQDGTLRAVAFSDENGTIPINDTIGNSIVKTPKPAKKLIAKTYKNKTELKADREDLAYVEVEVTDEDGNIIPDAANDIKFTVNGAGKLVGVDNGNSVDLSSYKADRRNAFSGKVLAIVQSTNDAGEISVTASADGLESTTVNITSNAVENFGTRKVVSYKISKNYYVKKGNMPVLPEMITVNYSDSTSVDEKVVWEEINQEKIEKTGTFVVKGTISSGDKVAVNINIIDNIAAVLNYSTTIPVGSSPSLPSSRPAVLSNGSVTLVNFPVTWNEYEDTVFANEGIVEVEGKSVIFGEERNVKASIRVQAEQITLGENIAPHALKLTSYQGGMAANDTLSAINDGKVEVSKNINGGANPTIWSNWSAAQAGIKEADIIFEYATQQRIGKININFAKDNSSLKYPDSNTTKFYTSDDGTTWTEFNVNEEIGDEFDGNRKEYRYNFTTVTFTFLKVHVKGSEIDPPTGRKATIGISEIELKKAVGSFNTFNTVGLKKLIVNDEEVSAEVLNSNVFETEALFIESINMESKDNTALTYISPLNAKEHFIVMESEDHSKTNIFTIRLGAEVSSNLSADDSSRDYDYTKYNVSAGNSEQREPATRAIDGNTDTNWHTDWSRVTPVENRHITLSWEESKKIEALRYFARNDGQTNGIVKKYEVEAYVDNSWQKISEGEWDRSGGWKVATFAPIETTSIRLKGIETYSDAGHQANKFMSAGELRVRLAKEKTDINSEDIKVSLLEDKIKVKSLDKPVEPEITVTKNNQPLKYGIDYRVKYLKNNIPGKAKAVVEGILKYSGKVEKSFYIISESSRELNVTNAKLYIEDELYDGQSGNFEKGQEIIVMAEPEQGKIFSHWRVTPSGVNFEEMVENNANILNFTMPEHSVDVKAVYKPVDGYVYDTFADTVPANWYASADTKVLDSILEENLTDEEKVALRNGEKISVSLKLTKSQTIPQTLATNANALQSIREIVDNKNEDVGEFYINPKLIKDVAGSKSDIENAYSIPVKIEVPKADRNMRDYRVVAYGKDEPEVIDTAYSDSFMEFIMSTDKVYGVYYNKNYEIKFVDFDDRLIQTVYVEAGGMPIAPSNPVREGYEFVSWGREVKKAYKNEVYKAVYKKLPVPEDIIIAKTKLKQYISFVKDELSSFDKNKYSVNEWEKLALGLQRAEDLLKLEKSTVADYENMVSTLKTLFNELKSSKITEKPDAKPNTERKEEPKPSSSSTESKEEPKASNPSTESKEEPKASSPSTESKEEPKASNPSTESKSEPKVNSPSTESKSDIPKNNITTPSYSGGGSGGGSSRTFSTISKTKQNKNSSSAQTKPLNTSIELKGNWVLENGVWQFKNLDGNKAINQWAFTMEGNQKIWYLFDQDGNMRTKWFVSKDNEVYYLNDAKTSKEGQMFTGWHWIMGVDNKLRCYYFSDKEESYGKMTSNATTIDGYTVNEQGEWVVNGVVQTMN